MVPRMLSTLLSYEAERRVIKGDSQGHIKGYSKKGQDMVPNKIAAPWRIAIIKIF